MPVTVEQEKLDPCRVALTIEVPPEDIQKAIDSVFNQFAKRTSVPGFRPGKAPRHLVARFIDEGRVRELAFDRALNDAYRAALKQAGVEPYQDADPKVDLPEEGLDPEKGFTFKATVPTVPQVELGDLEGLKARRVTTTITDEDVDKELARYREQLAAYAHTDEGAQDSDRVRATVEVSVEGSVVADASFPEPTLIQVGANIEDLDKGLVGIKTGEDRTFDFAYPADFGDPELAGKTATAKVHAFDVLRRTVPEATEELAQKLGFDDLAALRDRVRENLQAQADALSDTELNDSLIKEVVRRSTVHYPEELLVREISDRMSELIQALERRSLSLEDYLEAEKIALEDLQDKYEEEARESLGNTLVLLEVARAAEIRVTDREVEEELKRRAEAEGVKLTQLRRTMNESGELAALRNRIFFRKVTGHLRSRADIKEVEA